MDCKVLLRTNQQTAGYHLHWLYAFSLALWIIINNDMNVKNIIFLLLLYVSAVKHVFGQYSWWVLCRLEIMESMALHLESAYERLYRWTQSMFYFIFISVLSCHVNTCLLSLAKRNLDAPALFQSGFYINICLTTYTTFSKCNLRSICSNRQLSWFNVTCSLNNVIDCNCLYARVVWYYKIYKWP